MTEILKRIKELQTERWKSIEKIEPLTYEIKALLEAALIEDASNIIALTNLGAVYSDTGQHEKALQLLRKAENLQSQDRNLYRNIGIVLINLKKYEEGRRYMEISNKMESDDLTFEAYFDYQAH